MPMREISALALYDKQIFLASDHDFPFLSIPLAKFEPAGVNLETKREIPLLGEHFRKGAAQWEGLAIDGKGNFMGLKEVGSEIYLIGPEGKELRRWTTEAYPGKKNKRKGFEGILALKNGHILIALSKPAVLIEYGARGEKSLGLNASQLLGESEAFLAPPDGELSLLASWQLHEPKDCQFSEITKLDSKVFAILKDCHAIIEIPELKTTEKTFAALNSWVIPKAVEHAEGLLAFPGDQFLVAVDHHRRDSNLFWLSTEATPKPTEQKEKAEATPQPSPPAPSLDHSKMRK